MLIVGMRMINLIRFEITFRLRLDWIGLEEMR